MARVIYRPVRLAQGMPGMPMGRPQDPLAMAQLRTQMRENPEDIYQPQYDRVNYPAAGQFELSFFTQAIGASVTLIQGGVTVTKQKSHRDTNLTQPGVIPTKAMQIHGFSVDYIPVQQAVAGANTPSIVDDVQRLMYGGYFTLTLIDKPYLIVPNFLVPALGQVRGSVATTATAVTVLSAPGGGTGGVRDIFWIGVPLTVDPYQSFAVKMNFDGSPVVTQTYDINVTLHCYLRRPGQ